MYLSKKYINYFVAGFFLICLLIAIYYQKIAILTLPFAALIAIASIFYLKQVWYLLLVCIPLSFEFQLTDSLGLDLPDETLMLLLTGIFILLAISKSLHFHNSFYQHKITLLIVFTFLWYCITATFSTFPMLSFKFLLAKIWFIIPFTIMPWLFLKTKKDIIIAAICLSAPLVFTVLIVMYNHYQMHFLFDNVNNAVKPFYRNHVNYAALVVCTIPIIGCFYFSTEKQKHKYWLLAILIFLCIALFLSYSRGAWLALFIGVVSIYFLKKKILAYAFLASIAILIVAVVWLSHQNKYINYHPNYKKTIYHANFNEHINATFAGTDMSNAERFNRWIAGVKMITENKPTGFGPNTFYSNYKPYMVTYFKTWVSENKEKSTVHNYFLLTLIEQGWIGFLLLLSLLFYTFKILEKLYQNTTDLFYKNVVVTLSAILCMILTLNMLSDLMETDKIGALFYLCLGFTVLLDIKERFKST